MLKGVFITGTDTGSGKTWFTVTLMEALKKQGMKVAGMKPVASGAEWVDGKLVNEDAQAILNHCSEKIDYELINPAVFEPAIAPHIAANQLQQPIDLEQIAAAYQQLIKSADIVVVEGVGGWRVPVSNSVYLVEIVHALNLPVIMVVGLRLGCINHALLTAEVILADKINLCGWVSNSLEKDYLYRQETINTLKEKLPCKHIADLAYMNNLNTHKMAGNIDLSFI